MKLDLFVRLDGNLIIGEEPLARYGLRLVVHESACAGGTGYAMSIENGGTEALMVDSVGAILTAPKGRSTRQWRVFLDSGNCSWCGVKRLEALEPCSQMEPIIEQRVSNEVVETLPFHRSDLQTVLWDAASGQSILVGFLRQRHGSNKIDIIPNADASDIVRIEAWQELGIEMAPGAAQALDVLVVAQGDDPYGLLEGFAAAVQERHGRDFSAPPMVGMMTWYGYRTAVDEAIVLGNAPLVGELFGGYPQPMQNIMLLDHGWQEDANWGYWQPDRKRFEHGMKWLSAELSRHGLKLGLWYTPFCITENAPNHADLVALQSVDSQGQPHAGAACVWDALPGHSSDLWPLTFFDGGMEDVQAKWRRELEEMNAWGSCYSKLDFFALQTSDANRRQLGRGDLYKRTWDNFRETVGANHHLAPCSCDTNILIGYNDSVRIAADISNAGRWPGAMARYRYAMSTVAALWYKNRRFWINDADSIQVGKGCSLGEARVRATVAGLSGGHLMVSEDLRTLSPERLELVRRILPPYPQAARPLDLFENPFPEGYPSFWSLTVPKGTGEMTALAVFNLTDTTQRYEIHPRMLGIEPGQAFVALEWWQYRWLGRFSGALVIEVPAEDVAVIHAGPVGDVPSLVSVSHHITGGYIVKDTAFDAASGKLTGVLATKAGTIVNLFGQLPPHWGLSRTASFHGTRSSIGAWQSEMMTSDELTPFAIEFVKMEEKK